jgi:PhoH-like ATPase
VQKPVAPSSSKSTSKKKKTGERTFVLDTSVLLSDPKAMFRFDEHQVVLPVVVISELEKKRHDPEIGFFAREALRNLDELRTSTSV